MDSSPAQEDSKWIKLEDMDTIMISNPSYKDILFSDGKTKLLDLISSMKNLKTLKIFLQSFDINTSLPNDSPLWPGSTPLHLAVMFSESMKNLGKASNLIRQFLDLGASVQVQDNRGATPLHLAFHLNQQHVVAMLLRKLELKSEKVSNMMDRYNLSYLHIACTGNDHRYSLARKLLDHEGIYNNLNTAYNGEDLDKLKKGWTPLHVAVDLSQLSLAKLLIQKGASKLCVDARGCTPIHLLFGSTSIESKSFAEELFAEQELKENVAEDTGLTHLHVAVWFDDHKSVKRLLDLGANIDAKVGILTESLERFNDSTPLLMAMIKQHHRIEDILLKRGADVLAKKPDGTTPVSDVLTGCYGIAKRKILYLISRDDKLQRRLEDELGLTMLHIACHTSEMDKVQELLNNGKDVNARIPDYSKFWAGYTPLQVLVASSYNYYFMNEKTLAILQKLVQSGCDVDLQDSKGQTPLHLAVEKENYEITSELLMVGADLNVLDYNGKSPISYALELFIHRRTWYHGEINTAHSLILHTYKMKLVGMEVQNELSESLQTIALQKGNVTLKFPNESEFCDQVQATEKIKIGKRGLTLRSFLHETGAISLYPSLMPIHRKELDAFFQSFDEKKFPDLSPWLKTQYRKAITRLSLIEPASDALKNLINAGFPDLCIDLILKYLSNSQLRQLITAASIEYNDK